MPVRLHGLLISVLCMGVLFVGATAGYADTPRKLKPRNQTTGQAQPAPAPQPVPKVTSAPLRNTVQKPTAAGKTSKRLNDLDRAIDAARGQSKALKTKAKTLDDDIRNLRQGMVSAARLIQGHETRVADLARQLTEVTQSLAIKEESLRLRRKQMGKVLLALQRVAQYPPEALIVRPILPGDAVRSGILLRAVVPELERRAVTLRDDLDALRQTREEAERHKTELSSATTELGSQRKLLQTLIGRKSRLRRRTLAQSDQAQRRVSSLAKKARSIRDLMARLEALRLKREQQAKQQALQKSKGESKTKGVPNLQRPKDFTGKAMDTARGRLPYPVVGPVVARFGEKAKGGLSHKGLTISASGGAQVIAPYEGRVAFSGPFRGYGELLIIEHREGYHTLLAGMSRIDGVVGQWLLAGEPVGIMGTATSTKQKDKPTLYLEMRHKGQPINPLPWLANRKS
jgi:murein hydrolase activator